MAIGEGATNTAYHDAILHRMLKSLSNTARHRSSGGHSRRVAGIFARGGQGGVKSIPEQDLSLRKDYATVVQESRQPGNQDQNVSVGGVCGTSSSTYFVQVHRSSGLPTSAPFTLRFTEGT